MARIKNPNNVHPPRVLEARAKLLPPEWSQERMKNNVHFAGNLRALDPTFDDDVSMAASSSSSSSAVGVCNWTYLGQGLAKDSNRGVFAARRIPEGYVACFYSGIVRLQDYEKHGDYATDVGNFMVDPIGDDGKFVVPLDTVLDSAEGCRLLAHGHMVNEPASQLHALRPGTTVRATRAAAAVLKGSQVPNLLRRHSRDLQPNAIRILHDVMLFPNVMLDTNESIRRVRAAGLGNIVHLPVYAQRTVEPGEELLMDYGPKYDRRGKYEAAPREIAQYMYQEGSKIKTSLRHDFITSGKMGQQQRKYRSLVELRPKGAKPNRVAKLTGLKYPVSDERMRPDGTREFLVNGRWIGEEEARKQVPYHMEEREVWQPWRILGHNRELTELHVQWKGDGGKSWVPYELVLEKDPWLLAMYQHGRYDVRQIIGAAVAPGQTNEIHVWWKTGRADKDTSWEKRKDIESHFPQELAEYDKKMKIDSILRSRKDGSELLVERKLRRHPSDEQWLPRAVVEAQRPDLVRMFFGGEAKEVFTIDKILERTLDDQGVECYRVRWEGYEHDTLEPVENLAGGAAAKEFEASERRRRYRRR